VLSAKETDISDGLLGKLDFHDLGGAFDEADDVSRNNSIYILCNYADRFLAWKMRQVIFT